MSLLSEMRKAGMPPDVISFSATISECVKGKQLHQELSFVSEISKAYVTLNVFTFNTAISKSKKSRQ